MNAIVGRLSCAAAQSGRRGGILLLCGILLALLAGCQTPQYPPAPVTSATPDFDYRIGPLDTVNIIVWRNPELSMSVPVRPDGKITTPLVDDLPALGKTPTQLAARHREGARQVHPRSGRDGRRDDLRRPGQRADPRDRRGDQAAGAAVPQHMTLLDVMIAVGGLTDFADGNGARIFRVADGGKLYSVRLRDLVKRGDITANVDMRPGDILIIPQSWF